MNHQPWLIVAVLVFLFPAMPSYAANASNIKLCPALEDPQTYKENEDYSFIVQGKDGWLFRSRLDLKSRFRLTQRTLDSFARLNASFKNSGTDLVVMMMPTRGIMHHEMLSPLANAVSDGQQVPPYTDNFDYKDATKNYFKMLDELRKSGLIVADMQGLENVEGYFLKGDNHWTSEGARFSAAKVAEAVKKIPSYDSLKKKDFKTGAGQKKDISLHRYLEFVNKTCGTSYTDKEIKDIYTTQAEEAPVSEDALFSEQDTPEVTLLGTSNSTHPEPSFANFEGFLKEYLRTDVLNEAVSGGSLQGSIGNYLLNGDYARTKPKVIVWEINSYYGYNQQAFFREIIPAIYGECTDDEMLEQSSGDVKADTTPLFDGIAGKKYSSHKYYVALQLSNSNLRKVKIRFTHADGRTDTVKLDRSVRSFPVNPGLFYAELSDVMAAPLDKVALETSEGSGTYKARICRAPELSLPPVHSAQKEVTKPAPENPKETFWDGLKKYAFSFFPSRERYEILPVAKVSAAPQPLRFPDLNAFRAEEIIASIPQPQKGEIKIEDMEGAPPLRKFAFDKRLVEFQNIQKRVEPKAVHIYSGVYTLPDLLNELKDSGALVEKEQGYLLRLPVAVYPGAALVIKDLPKPLLLSQDKGVFIVSAGNIFVVNSRVTGWSESRKAPAILNPDYKNFRPFITMWDGSTLYMAGSGFSHLGYGASKSYGITLSTNDVVQEEFEEQFGNLPPPTGWLLGNSFENMYFGFYSYEARNVVVMDNVYKDNVIYGIDPHDRSQGLIIARNTITGTKKKHGIVMSRDVDNSFILYNTVQYNKGSGVMLDRNCRNNVIAFNTLRENHGDGLTIYESPDNILHENTVERNDGGGVRIRNSWNIAVTGGKNRFNKKPAFMVYRDTLEDTGRDFELDPVIAKAGAVFSGIQLENNGGVLNAKGMDSVKLENINLQNAAFVGNGFGGALASLEEQIREKMAGSPSLEIRRIQ